MIAKFPDMKRIGVTLSAGYPPGAYYAAPGVVPGVPEQIQLRAPSEQWAKRLIGHELGGHGVYQRKGWSRAARLGPRHVAAAVRDPNTGDLMPGISNAEADRRFRLGLGEIGANVNMQMDANDMLTGAGGLPGAVRARDVPASSPFPPLNQMREPPASQLHLPFSLADWLKMGGGQVPSIPY